jgi:hypothetical protein
MSMAEETTVQSQLGRGMFDLETTEIPANNARKNLAKTSQIYYVIEISALKDSSWSEASGNATKLYNDLANRVELFLEDSFDSNHLQGLQSFQIKRMVRQEGGQRIKITMLITIH